MKGEAGFDKFYRDVFGARWDGLRNKLLEPALQIARLNAFATQPFSVSENLQGVRYLTNLPARLPVADANGLMDVYWMDLASLAPAVALAPEPGEEILDLCAAPGGKSLILFEQMKGQGRLVANELSDRRRARLKAVFHDYVPAELLTNIDVTHHDGMRWCLYEQDAFDRILLDAPCSGERHLLHNPEELKLWSRARSKNLAVRQYTLLASALQVVRPGGVIVYSTCSLSPLENDAVIARLLKKKAGQVHLEPLEFAIGEKTELGWQILPDQTGFGPIYFSRLRRENV